MIDRADRSERNLIILQKNAAQSPGTSISYHLDFVSQALTRYTDGNADVIISGDDNLLSQEKIERIE